MGGSVRMNDMNIMALEGRTNEEVVISGACHGCRRARLKDFEASSDGCGSSRMGM